MTTVTNNDFIDSLLNNDGMEQDEKLMLWVQMSDAEKLLEELKMSGTLASMGMKRVSLADQFAYGALRIARPELFESK